MQEQRVKKKSEAKDEALKKWDTYIVKTHEDSETGFSHLSEEVSSREDVVTGMTDKRRKESEAEREQEEVNNAAQTAQEK